MSIISSNPSAWDYDQAELDALKEFLPGKYADTTYIGNIPNSVRAAAWSAAIEEDYTDVTKELFSKIWNFRIAKDGIDRDSDGMREVIESIYVQSGAGSYFNPLEPFLYSLDRYNSIRIPTNLEFNGPLFITRPRLCLQLTNLRNHRVMSALDTKNPNSIAFMIRALLDTNLAKHNPELAPSCHYSKIFDYQNPFITPLCNAVSSATGFPDIMLETATTSGGFMQEAQQFAIGSDNLHRGSYEINLTFKDVQYGPIAALFYYWIEYIRCVTRGYMLAYADDIDQQRINYTVSIYAFNLDPSRRYITRWCKCTGCFPKSLPTGAFMNREYNGAVVKAASEMTIPFVCNIVEYMDPWILMDFNKLVTRYCHDINKNRWNYHIRPDDRGVAIPPNTAPHRRPPMPPMPSFNLSCLPYVTSDPNGMRLEWRLVKKNIDYYTHGADNPHGPDYGILEFLAQEKAFSTDSGSFLKPINDYYYPGFSDRVEGSSKANAWKLLESLGYGPSKK